MPPLKGTQMGTVKMVHFWDLSGTFDCYSYSKMLQNLRKRIPALKKRVVVTFSAKYELFEDHFRTFTPDPDQRQGSVQPITKHLMMGFIPDLHMPKVFFTREGQQMVHLPDPVIY